MTILAEQTISKKEARKLRKFTRPERSWIMYDWANSIYATNIMAALFPIYFAMVATDTGDRFYGYAVSLANLLVAVLAPLLGAIGDYKGMKKKLFIGFLVVGLVFTATMAIFDNWQLMLIGFVISRIGFSGSILFYDSFLTDVTTPDRMDRVSAWGYAMGYIGGSTIPFLISIAILFLMNMSVLGMKISILIVVVWWALFSIPFLINVKQVYSVDEKPNNLAKSAWRNCINTLKNICRDKRVLWFIIAYFFYIDGVDTIISMATNYGSNLGLDSIGMILALLVTQVVAVPFSILFGHLGRKYGAVRMISVAVVVYFVITVIGFGMGFIVENPFVVSYLGLEPTEANALMVGETLFWALACLVGTVQGGIQALSRSFFGQIIPPERSNEYFGFLDIFGKFSCIIGPALYSFTAGATGSEALGILSVILLFFFGAIALLIGRKHFKQSSAPMSAAE